MSIKVTTIPLLALMFLGFTQNPGSSKVALGEEFKLKNGQQAIVRGEKLRIKIQSVTDSRCPTGATCIWAGNGEVVVEVAKRNKKQVVARLNTSSDPKEIEYRGFKIKLIALNPHPRVNESIDPKDYEATMVVTKDE